MSHLPRFPLVTVTGTITSAQVEESEREEKIDHVWINVACGLPHPVVISVNTRSLRSARDGYDPRVRVAVVRENQTHLPAQGTGKLARFDYEEFGKTRNIFFEKLSRKEAEDLLLGLCSEAVCLEAWGEPYCRHHREGLHQIHSRQPSHAFPQGAEGRDGGLRFYFQAADAWESRTVLIQFDGQK